MKNNTIYSGKVRLFIEKDKKVNGSRQFYHTDKGKFNSFLFALLGLRLVTRVTSHYVGMDKLADMAAATGFTVRAESIDLDQVRLDDKIYNGNLEAGSLEDLAFFYNNNLVAVSGQRGVLLKVVNFAEGNDKFTMEKWHLHQGLGIGYVTKSGPYMHLHNIGDKMFDPSYRLNLQGMSVEFTKPEMYQLKVLKHTPEDIITNRLPFSERGTVTVETMEQSKQSAIALYNYLEAWQGR